MDDQRVEMRNGGDGDVVENDVGVAEPIAANHLGDRIAAVAANNEDQGLSNFALQKLASKSNDIKSMFNFLKLAMVRGI